MRIEYDSNNSGGSWWLKDEHWLALERAGWHVEWGGLVFCSGASYRKASPKTFMPKTPCKQGTCSGHRRFESAGAMQEAERSMGALATSAWREAATMREAIEEWERITGLDSTDDGCNCCGPPHTFKTCGEGPATSVYASGSSIVAVLYGTKPLTARQAAELQLKVEGGEQ